MTGLHPPSLEYECVFGVTYFPIAVTRRAGLTRAVLDSPSGFSARDALKTTAALILYIIAAGAVGIALFGVVRWMAAAAHVGAPAWADTDSPMLLVLGNTAGFALGLRYALRKANSSWRNLFVSHPTTVGAFIALLVAIAGFMILESEISNAVAHVFPVPDWVRRNAGQLRDLAHHPISAPLSLLVVAPVTEELFFRGLILRRLLTSNSAARSVAISAALFMAIHVNPWQFPSALGAGLLLGWLYLRTRSLALCMSSHALVNGCVLLAPGVPFAVRGFNTPHAGGAAFQPWWFDALGIVLLGAGLLALHRAMPPLSHRPATAESPVGSPEPAASAAVRAD